MKSLVLIIPAELRDSANPLGDVLGMGPNNYSVPLSTGNVITHYGLHAWSDEAFIEMLETGTLPEGVEFPELQQVLDALIISTRLDNNQHFQDVLEEHNLTLYDPDSTNT